MMEELIKILQEEPRVKYVFSWVTSVASLLYIQGLKEYRYLQ